MSLLSNTAARLGAGLAISEAGYTLVPQATSLVAGAAVPFLFTVAVDG